MNINFELVDANNAQHCQMYSDMNNQFRQDYNMSGDIPDVDNNIDLSKNTSTIYFIKVNDQYAGFNTLYRIAHPESQKTIAYVSEVIYIHKQFRSNNIATEVRKQMRLYKQKTENLDIIGSRISIQRVKRKMKYFINQQFKYMYNVCDDFQTMRCQTDDDQAIVLLTYNMLPAPYVAMFPFKVRMSLAINAVDKYKTFYKKWCEKHSYKFSNIQSQEFQTYLNEVYLK